MEEVETGQAALKWNPTQPAGWFGSASFS